MLRQLFSGVASHEISIRSAIDRTNDVDIFKHLLVLATQCIRIDVQAFRLKEFSKANTKPSPCLKTTLICNPSDIIGRYSEEEEVWYDSELNDGNHVYENTPLQSFYAWKAATIRFPLMLISTATEETNVSCKTLVCGRDKAKRTIPSPNHSAFQNAPRGDFSYNYHRLLKDLWSGAISVDDALSSIYEPSLFHDIFVKSAGTFLVTTEFHRLDGATTVFGIRVPALEVDHIFSSANSRVEDVFCEPEWDEIEIIKGDAVVSLSSEVQAKYQYPTVMNGFAKDSLQVCVRMRFLMSNSWSVEVERPLNEDDKRRIEEARGTFTDLS